MKWVLGFLSAGLWWKLCSNAASHCNAGMLMYRDTTSPVATIVPGGRGISSSLILLRKSCVSGVRDQLFQDGLEQ